MIQKLKELSKDTAIYGISTIIGRFLGFLLIPFYTNVLSTAEFGIYSYIYAFLGFFNVVYIYGMDAAFMKYHSLAEDSEKKDTFSTPFLFVLFSSIIFSAFFLLFRYQIGGLLQIQNEYKHLISYFSLILLFDAVVLIPFANLRLQRKSKKFAAIKITNILLNLGLNFILIINFGMGIEGIFISNLVSSAVTFLILIPDIFTNLSFTIVTKKLKIMLKFALPYLPASFAAMMVQVIDVPIVRFLTNDDTLGIYRANYKLGIFMMLVVSMFQYAWQPFFLSNAKEKDAKELFSKVLTLFVVAASLLWVVLALFIDNIAAFEFLPGRSLIGKEYLSGVHIVPIILLGYLFFGMYVNFQAGLYIEEKTKYFPLVTGIGAAANVIVNFLLIPVWGIYGAAVATLVSYFVMAAGLFIVAQRFYKINYEYSKIIKVLVLILIITYTYYYLFLLGILLFLYKILLLVFFILSLFGLNIIQSEDVKKTLKAFAKK
ncbi:MAG: hypothetical protein A2068_07440 [Ignavibacteria bacterium GWB2_35_6b]|nr:MAG: hypothetical protein A2068_07440 [Ignavibacteria bacterium GWB2_35_6b]